MKTFEFFRGDTLRCFNIFIDSLKSTAPIGSESMRASCGSLCSSLNSLLDYLYQEKRQVINKKFSVNCKKDFLKKICEKTYNFIEYKAHGSNLKLVIDIGNAFKHMEIDRHKPYISNINQVKECFIAVLYKEDDDFYIAVDKGVLAHYGQDKLVNLEVTTILSLEIVIRLIIELGIIDEAPNLKPSYRNFDYSEKEANQTLERTEHLCVFPQYSESTDTPLLIQIFDKSYPMNMRDKQKKDGAMGFKLKVPVKVEHNPLLKKPR